MREEYVKELEDLKTKMGKAEKFAGKIPVFSKDILENKYTGEEPHINFGKYYKEIYFAWGVTRGYYSSAKDSKRTITNFRGDYAGYFFNVYINTLTLYDLHENFGLYESLEEVDIFFTDAMNSTFYITDENIENFLDTLCGWYKNAISKVKSFKIEQELDELKKTEQRLKDELSNLDK